MLVLTTPAAANTDLPMNTPTQLGDIEVVCTGVGSTWDDPRWKAYPFKLIFAAKAGHYVSDVDVTITPTDRPEIAVRCGGPWLLMKLPAGRYHFAGRLDGTSAAADAVVPGSVRAVLRFPVTP